MGSLLSITAGFAIDMTVTPTPAELLSIIFAEQMTRYEEAWAARRKRAIPAAVIWADTCGRPNPPWLRDAIVKALSDSLSDSEAQHEAGTARHWLRYQAVLKTRTAGLSWPQSYDRAAEALATTAARGEPDTMCQSYKLVAADLKADHRGRYLQLDQDRLQGK